jgi:hypothetical protein
VLERLPSAQRHLGRLARVGRDPRWGPSATNVHLCFWFPCGSFSYSELPKSYHRILGVSATLLFNESEQRVLEEEFKILKKTVMPSTFGANICKPLSNETVRIESDADWHQAIVSEMERRLGSGAAQRAVIIFFASAAELQRFADSAPFARFKENAQALTEDTSEEDRDGIIKAATIQGAITLSVASFSRGTDLRCDDQRVLDAGGLHVLGAFLPNTEAGEKQMVGRTGRQGNSGSVSYVLRDSDLTEFGISQQDIQAARSPERLYDVLKEKRKAYNEKRSKQQEKQVAAAKRKHDASMAMLTQLAAGNVKAAQDFVNGEDD